MKKKLKKNQQGSVLLTVLCFMMVIMIMASSAVELASFSSKKSNTNVRSTQAEISAENYLREFLLANSANGYESIQNSVGAASIAAPKQYNASLVDASGASVNGVSNDARILAWKTTDGIVLKSIANSNGVEESSTAFLSGDIPSPPYTPANCIETNRGITGTERALEVNGDVLNESAPSDTSVTRFHNSQSFTNGNYIASGNLFVGSTTEAYMGTTRSGKAPILAASGNMIWGQAHIGSSVPAETTTSGSNVVKTTGYVYVGGVFYSYPVSKGETIGTTGLGGQEIDLYCENNAYFGYLPQYLPGQNNVQNPDFDTINSLGLGGISLGSMNAGENSKIKGNIVVKGDLYLYSDMVVNGNVTVAGDVYVFGNGRNATINGTLSCGGSIKYVSGNTVSSSGTGLSCSNITSGGFCSISNPYSTLTGNQRFTDVYNGSSSNEIFNDDYKDIKTHYAAAYVNKGYKVEPSLATPNVNLSDWKEFVYRDEACNQSVKDWEDTLSDPMNQGLIATARNHEMTLYVNAGGNASSTHVYYGCNFSQILSDINDSAAIGHIKFVIKLDGNEDFIAVMPQTNNNKLNFYTDFSQSYATGNVNHPVSTDPYRNVDTPKNFCYFMMDTGSSDGSEAYTYTGDPAEADLETYYNNHKWKLTNTTIIDITRFNNGITQVNDNTQPVIDSEGQNLSNKTAANNNFVLVPNYYNIDISNNDTLDGGLHSIMQAVIYGPKSRVNANGTGSNQRTFLGQALVSTFNIENNATEAGELLAAPGSLLDHINTHHGGGGTLQLAYFTKHKE